MNKNTTIETTESIVRSIKDKFETFSILTDQNDFTAIIDNLLDKTITSNDIKHLKELIVFFYKKYYEINYKQMKLEGDKNLYEKYSKELLKKIKELEIIIKNHEKQISFLESSVNELKSKNVTLESSVNQLMLNNVSLEKKILFLNLM